MFRRRLPGGGLKLVEFVDGLGFGPCGVAQIAVDGRRFVGVDFRGHGGRHVGVEIMGERGRFLFRGLAWHFLFGGRGLCSHPIARKEKNQGKRERGRPPVRAHATPQPERNFSAPCPIPPNIRLANVPRAAASEPRGAPYFPIYSGQSVMNGTDKSVKRADRAQAPDRSLPLLARNRFRFPPQWLARSCRTTYKPRHPARGAGRPRRQSRSPFRCSASRLKGCRITPASGSNRKNRSQNGIPRIQLASALGSWRAFRSSYPALEPQNGAVPLWGTQRHSHHRSHA